MLNKTLAPDAVIARIDALAATIAPAIPFENGRWDGAATMDEWEANVEQLRDFARRRPDIVRQQLVDELLIPGIGVSGTAVLTIAAPPDGLNSVAINGS